MSHVITRLKGGSGNQMFQYAAGHALATRLGVPLLIDRSFLDLRGKKVDWTLRDFELDVFRLPITFATAEQVAELDLRDDPLSRLRQAIFDPRSANVLKENSLRWNEAFEHCSAPVLLDGFWQNERYFNSVADQLRNELFLPMDPPSPENAAIIQAIERQVSASVHIRRGDYVHDPVTAAYHGALPLAYYEEAAAWLIENKGVDHFFVFSDDPTWVLENLHLPRVITVVQHNTRREAHWDLHLMKHCAHHIIANSSFSWWGAWLDAKADKTVIAPKNWLLDPSMDMSGTIPNTWRRI